VEQKDVSGFASEIGTSGEGQTGIGLCKCSGVIDAVAGHGDFLALRLQVTDSGELVGG